MKMNINDLTKDDDFSTSTSFSVISMLPSLSLTVVVVMVSVLPTSSLVVILVISVVAVVGV